MLTCLKNVYNHTLGINVITLSDGSQGVTTSALCFYSPIWFLGKKDIARVMRIVHRTDVHSFLYTVLPGENKPTSYLSEDDFRLLVRTVVTSPLKELLLKAPLN